MNDSAHDELMAAINKNTKYNILTDQYDDSIHNSKSETTINNNDDYRSKNEEFFEEQLPSPQISEQSEKEFNNSTT